MQWWRKEEKVTERAAELGWEGGGEGDHHPEANLQHFYLLTKTPGLGANRACALLLQVLNRGIASSQFLLEANDAV